MYSRLSKPLVPIIAFLLAFSYGSVAQKEQPGKSAGGFLTSLQLKPIIDFQLWGTYTHGTRIVDTVPGQFIDVDNRANFVLRRGRLGFTAHPHERLQVSTIAQIDFIGRDVFAGYPGGSNNTTFPEIGLWDLRITWQVRRSSDLLYLTGGYFAPQFAREHITPWHFVSSLAKAYSQTYMRRHITGKGPGRSIGINAGGLARAGEKFWLKYDLGLYNPVFAPSLINTSGYRSSIMISGRLSFQFGQPESDKYSHMLSNPNAFNGRRSVSIGISASTQGNNAIFNSSSGLAFDFLINRGKWHIEGEYAYLWRTGTTTLPDGSQDDIAYGFTTGFIRTGYNFSLAKDQILEPSVSYIRFDGSKELTEQEKASELLSPSGSTWSVDTGVNWHVVRNRVKVSLHYTFQGSDAGEAGAGNIFNELIVQSGTKIQRGNWLGLGLVLRL